MPKIEDQISKITQDPGVYIFYSQADKIIYIGKAIKLRNRVRSYWNKSTWRDRPKLGALVPRVKRIETIITKSEKEALILEANLVFKHQPRYNVLLKDNKSFPWLVITNEEYPRLLPIRNIERYKKYNPKASKNKFFGPYTNVGAMYENLNLVNELFPLRKKRVPPFKNRPCLNYDLGKCLGPCQKLISPEDYQNMLDQVIMLLKGNYQDLKTLLTEEMYRFSDLQEYEKAAKLRNQLQALETFNEKQNVITDDYKLEQDVFTLVFSKGSSIGDNETDAITDLACMQVFKTRAGKLINRDSLELELKLDESQEQAFEAAFVQYYTQIPDSELPKEILVSHKFVKTEEANEVQAKFLENWLSERKESKVTILKPQRGDKYALVKLALKNADVSLERLKLEKLEEASKDINIALENLQTQLDLRSEPSRIECFDISHIQGTNVVASMVTFIDGMPDKSEYRRFKISVDQNNDFESMREVVTRRYSKHVSIHTNDDKEISYEGLPNLIIIDGGKGQLSSAKQILDDLGLSHLQVVGLAKREEEIFFPEESKPVVLDRRSPELFLVQRIRNEAHRFAITYHRKLRAQKSTQSILDQIPGIGPAKRKALLKYFGTVTKLKDASAKEIADIPGFNTSLANKVHHYLKSNS